VSLFGARRHPRTAALPVEGHLPSFDGATGWLNSSPLTPAELRGRVVLVDFWTYTCINWLRTLAFVRAWDAKCRDLGLDVIGVHTPEFSPSRSALAARGRERRIGRSRLAKLLHPVLGRCSSRVVTTGAATTSGSRDRRI
jgi:hypothetical protein